MRKLAFILGVCVISVFGQTARSQENSINVDLVFKLHLFLDHKNVYCDVLPNDSLLKVILNDCELVLEKLEIKHNWFVSFPPKFEVYRLVDYSFKSKSGCFQNLNTFEQDAYMIAIDNSSGRSYKLKGFLNNDFKHFLTDYLEAYNRDHSTISLRVLKNLINIDGLDIDCLYKSIGHFGRDYKKYPCLSTRHDPIIIR